MFEHTWRELELWLEHLHDPAEHRREAVLQFLERVSAARAPSVPGRVPPLAHLLPADTRSVRQET